MKKLLVSILISICLCSPAFAVIPVIVLPYVAASLALHVAGAAAGLYYYMKQGGVSSSTSAGDVSRPSEVSWVNTADLTSSTPTVQTKSIDAKITNAQIKQIAASDPAKYPKLTDALKYTPPVKDVLSSQPLAAGEYMTYQGQTYKINSSIYKGVQLWGFTAPTTTVVKNGATVTVYYPYDYTTMYRVQTYEYNVTAAAAPSPVPATPIQFHEKITNNIAGDTVINNYQTEIDLMLQDPAYVPSFTDSTTGLPYSPPASTTIATPQQVADANTKNAAKNTAEQAVTSATDAATSAGTAATKAGNAYAASGGDLATGVGGDQTLYQKYLDAKAVEGAAKAAADKLAAKQAADATKALDDAAVAGTGLPSATAPSYDGTVTTPDKKDIKTMILGYIQSSPLFTLIRSVAVSTSSEESSFSYNYRGQTIQMDFTRWDYLFSAAGAALLALTHGMSIFLIFRR